MSQQKHSSVRSKSCDKCGVRFVATDNQGLCKKCNHELCVEVEEAEKRWDIKREEIFHDQG